jgi:hypothetical protein
MKPVVRGGQLFHDAEKLEDIGDFYSEWGLGNKHVIVNQSSGDLRHLSQLRIHIDSADVYQEIHGTAANDFLAFVLQPNAVFPNPLPNGIDRATQLAPINATDPRENMFLLMQKKHITFDGATQELRLQRGLLAAVGGANNWGNGKPYFCPLSNVLGVIDPATGVLVQEVAANMSAGLLTRLTANQHSKNGTPNATFRPILGATFAIDGVSEVTGTRNSFVNGTKSLFMTQEGNRYWQHEVRYRRRVKMSYRAQYNINPVFNAPAPGSYIIAESYDLYTQVRDVPGQPEEHPAEVDSIRVIKFLLYDSDEVSPFFGIPILDDGVRLAYTGLNDEVKTNHWDQYLKSINQAGRDAELEIQEGEDTLLEMLKGCWGGRVLTIVPFFIGESVCVPTKVENQYTVKLREKLFGYKTVGFLKPFQIYNDQFGEFFPLALQDYNLTFDMQNDIYQLIGLNQLTKYGVKNIISDESRIFIRSKDGVNQDDKELEKVAYSYPEIQRYTSLTKHTGETVAGAVAKAVVMCRSGAIMPDYFFVYAERRDTTGGYSNEPPKVVQLEIRRNQQSIRMYHDTVMTKHDILDMTRRNSHPRADQKQLYSDYGGVLISRYDIGTILDDQLDTKLLELEFTVTLEREPSEVIPVGILPDMVDELDNQHGNNLVSDQVQERIVDAEARYRARIQKDTQTTVLFIWGDGSNLAGNARKMEFTKIAF